MTNYYLQKLTSISSSEGHIVEASFAGDGFTGKVDLRPWIQRGGVRAALADRALFEQVFVNEFGAPEWPGEIDLSPGTLRAWCEAGRVLTKEETGAWVADAHHQVATVA
jgi:hypothetical protein